MNLSYRRRRRPLPAIVLIFSILTLLFHQGSSAWADKPTPVANAQAAEALRKTAGSPAASHSKDTAAKVGDAVYRIGIGDVLMISVWKDESLTSQVIVLPDGTISFPLIGQVRVDGLALAELKSVLVKKLERYVPDVTLSLQVIQTGSRVIYVIGKVNRPGRFDLTGNISVLQALAVAGGLNSFARSKSIRIFRDSGRNMHVFQFNYDEVAKGQDLQQNIRLERGDVIVVR